MKIADLRHRVSKLERGSINDTLLRFADGSTLAVRVGDPLALTLAAMRRQHARDMGCEIPETRHRRTLDLLQRAESVDCGSEPLIGLAHNVCRGGSQ